MNREPEDVLSAFQKKLMHRGLHIIENHAVYSKFSLCSGNTSIVAIFTPFALVDLLGTAFICRFNGWDNHSKHKFNAFLQAMAVEIGEMGDALIHDWEVLGLNDYGVGLDASQVLSLKFFDPRSDLHRKNFSDWFKSLLHHNDPIVQCFILQATLTIHQSFLKKLMPCFSGKGNLSNLILLNGKWFNYFQSKMRKQMKLLESELSPEQENIISKEVNEMLTRFISQLDKATQALVSIEKNPINSSKNTLRMSM